MKKIKNVATTLMVLSALCGVGILSSCGGDVSASDSVSTSVEATLESIAITKAPTKVTYTEGELFEKAGMIVVATYSNKSVAAVKDYTIDKLEALTLEDTVVTITYKGKTATQAITVKKAKDPVYLATVDKKGTYRVEAEDIDFSECTSNNPNDATFIEIPSANLSNTSNGKAAGRLGIAGNHFEISVMSQLTEDVDLDIVFKMAYGGGNPLSVDGSLEIAYNDEILKTNAYLDKGDGSNTYWNWQPFTVSNLTLVPGKNTLSFLVQNEAPNIDCFDFVVDPEDVPVEHGIDATIEAVGSVLVEAENLDLSKCVLQDGVASFIEVPTSGQTSGGKSLGGIAGGSEIDISIDAKDKATIDVSSMMAKYEEDFSLEGNVEFSLDGNAPVSTSGTFGHTEENLWWNWKKISIGTFNVEVGKHILKLKVIGSCPNIDSFTIDVTSYGTPIEITKDLVIDEIKDYTVEAENLDLSKCFYQEGKTSFVEEPSNATSGGKSIGGVAAGSVITITFELAQKGTVAISSMMAKYEDNFTLSNNVGISVDGGNNIEPNGTFGHTEEILWWNWKEITIGTFDFESGIHTLKLTVTGACPNIDCFNFKVKTLGEFAQVESDVTIDANGTFVVEAENLDLSKCFYQEGKTSFVEEPSNATSGGKSIGGVAAGSVITIKFNLLDKAQIDLSSMMAKYENDFTLSGNVTFDLDGAVQLTPNGTFGHTEDILWWNWQNISLGTFGLEAGLHTLTITVNGACPNIDCFNFIATEFGNEIVKSDLVIDGQKQYVVEAENLDFSSCIHQEGVTSFVETPSVATSGGKSTCGIVAGSVIELVIDVKGHATFDISAMMAKYEADFNLASNVKITFDGGSPLTPNGTFGHTEENLWWNWKEISLGSFTVEEGIHTLKLEVIGALPNTDCFNFNVTSFSA